ncbi:MAG: UvrB/UvrC motif-containing protein, partial [Oscillospiraceae bacterium]|nr:UvrB/UvrC motif-containing protein [Oscillospiraceae bacterium]
SMERAITETIRRRGIQQQYNEEHGIVPTTIQKEVREILEISTGRNVEERTKRGKKLTQREREELIAKLTVEMKNAAKILEFEHAAYLRDKIKKLKEESQMPRAPIPR